MLVLARRDDRVIIMATYFVLWLIKLGLPENKNEVGNFKFLEFPKSFIAIQFFFQLDSHSIHGKHKPQKSQSPGHRSGSREKLLFTEAALGFSPATNAAFGHLQVLHVFRSFCHFLSKKKALQINYG